MRNNQVLLFAGARGVGKTDLVKSVIRSSSHDKKLLIDTFDSTVWRTMKTWDHLEGINQPIPIMDKSKIPLWQNGFYRICDSDTNAVMYSIQRSVSNALLVFEDATRYIGSRLTDDVKRFVLDSKQKNLDIIFIFHSLVSIPPDLVRIADTLTLFKTNEGQPSKTKYPFGEIPIMMDKLRKSTNRFENYTIRLN